MHTRNWALTVYPRAIYVSRRRENGMWNYAWVWNRDYFGRMPV